MSLICFHSILLPRVEAATKRSLTKIAAFGGGGGGGAVVEAGYAAPKDAPLMKIFGRYRVTRTSFANPAANKMAQARTATLAVPQQTPIHNTSCAINAPVSLLENGGWLRWFISAC